ncbi:glycosyltransferase [Effusibacillus pohliae]|uniref:glycosyltransferase n=1 Tax=Effusibacillus pohliae TaxID=232270 RepID=UPI000369F56C|nr:glycosyltransferase [Effusibacillus pohliae]
MNVLIVLPPNQPRSGGNVTYSNRIKKGLAPHGIHVEIRPLDHVRQQDFQQADIIHAFNAFRTGRFVLPTVKQMKKPMILTITGTDINEYMTKEETRDTTYSVVDYASRIILLTESSRRELLKLVPVAEPKSFVVHLGIDLPQGSCKQRADFGLAADDFVFLLPAGIRPVKNPLAAYEPLRRLQECHPAVRFAVAGPAMDPDLFAEFKKRMDAADWAIYLGEVDHGDMPALLRSSDVVLNTSKSEGLSHALLEAMSLGKPVIASRVPGNIDLIRDGENGFLFSHQDEFIEKATLYIEDPQLRQRLANAGRRWVQERYSTTREIEMFKQIYNDVMCREHLLNNQQVF